jgi:hypothetical protein
MKCPHCLVQFHAEITQGFQGRDVDGEWFIERTLCPNPECMKFVFWITNGTDYSLLVYPKATSRPLPPEVPQKFAEDFNEAVLVLPDSPKASAALSRRCLQRLLREVAGVKPGNLSDEIDEVIPQLPPYLARDIDAIRNTGNFSAHPIKSQSTGEIVDVEPGEAEWNLDVLEELFKFYFIDPALSEKKRKTLDKKLGDAGKPPMK